MRFRPEQHVRRQSDFRYLRENGRRLDCGGFTLWYCQRPPERGAAVPDSASGEVPVAPSQGLNSPVIAGLARVGVVASYAAVGKAVFRARAKRRLREIFRKHQRLVPAGYDVMLVSRHSINRMEFSALERRFTDACKKAFPGHHDIQAQGKE